MRSPTAKHLQNSSIQTSFFHFVHISQFYSILPPTVYLSLLSADPVLYHRIMRPVSASPIQEIILWAPLLGVLIFAAIMRHPKMEHSHIKRWLHHTTLIPSCFHPFFRFHSTISPLLSLSLSSTLAFFIAGLLPLCLRAAYLAVEFPVWSLGYRNSGVEAKGGRTLGEMNFFTLAFVMLPVTHTSILGYLTGISMERAIVFHRIWARLTIIIMGMHGIWMWVAFGTASSSIPPVTPENVGYPFIIRNEIKPFSFVLQMSRDSVTGWSNLSGLLAFICFAGMGVTSLPYFRRKLFETFHATHLFLALLGFIFAFLHMPAIARYAAPAWALYALDLCLRLYRAHRWHGMAEIIPLESGITRVIVHLKEKKKLKFEAGQYAFLRIPTLSYFQNHPFSISSSPHSDTITFHILAMGNDKTWTSRLRLLGNKVKDVEANTSNLVTCYVDGAYGIPAIRHFSYPILVLVCGGIGITPAASIISYLLQSTLTTFSSSISTSVSRIILIWTVSNRSIFETFDDMLTQSHSCSAVELHLYNTDRKHQEMVQVTNRANEDKMDVIPLEKQPGSWKDQIRSGRPNMSSILTEIARLHDPSQVAVMACGPEPLVLTTRDVCHDLNLAFHRETFLL